MRNAGKIVQFHSRHFYLKSVCLCTKTGGIFMSIHGMKLYTLSCRQDTPNFKQIFSVIICSWTARRGQTGPDC